MIRKTVSRRTAFPLAQLQWRRWKRTPTLAPGCSQPGSHQRKQSPHEDFTVHLSQSLQESQKKTPRGKQGTRMPASTPLSHSCVVLGSMRSCLCLPVSEWPFTKAATAGSQTLQRQPRLCLGITPHQWDSHLSQFGGV